MRRATWPVAVVVIAVVLYCLPGRADIAPRIQADNNYIYLAADRLYAGHGLSAIRPHAPLQAWEWQTDWAFLTQWPPGYPVLLCAVRFLLRCTTVEAGQTIAVVACALAMVGWFAWVRRAVPKGVAGTLLAAVAGGSAVSTAALIDPCTDILVVALLPFVLLLARSAVGEADGAVVRKKRYVRLVVVGLFAGSLCWIRYAAVYAPVGIGLYLVAQWLIWRRVRFAQVAVFGLAAIVPVVALLAVNHLCATSVPVQEQLNLGISLKPSFDPAVVATAWGKFTNLPFYDYHWYSHWVFALVLPVGGIGIVCLTPTWRGVLRRFAGSSTYLLSACSVFALLALLVVATALFRAKYDYVGLDRYYVAVRPLYFLLFVAPVLWIPRRSIRVLACIPLLLCCSWYVHVEWPQPYKRWLAADRPFTDYGRWAVCFDPGSGQLYDWLREQNSANLIVFSNFHDDIALETWVPANPLPEDEEQLTRWVDRICQARAISALRVLFVLDPSNHHRDYFLAAPEDVVAQFALTRHRDAPAAIAGYVFDWGTDTSVPYAKSH